MFRGVRGVYVSLWVIYRVFFFFRMGVSLAFYVEFFLRVFRVGFLLFLFYRWGGLGSGRLDGVVKVVEWDLDVNSLSL